MTEEQLVAVLMPVCLEKRAAILCARLNKHEFEAVEAAASAPLLERIAELTKDRDLMERYWNEAMATHENIAALKFRIADLKASVAGLEAKLAQRVPEWNGLVEGERNQIVEAICEYGTGFVTPLYAIVAGIERKLMERNAAPAAPEQQEPTKRCPNCDDTGDVHGIDGEWRGVCHCPAGQAINEQVKPSTNSIVQAAVIRALDEASVRNEVLRGMCLEVALEKARDMLEGLK